MEKGYAVCLNKWTLDSSIKNELRLLLIVSSLCAKEGYCWATNEHLAKLFGETERSISRKLNKLIAKGYITAEYEKRGGEVIKRTLRTTNLSRVGRKKCPPTEDKNVQENNISNKNINIGTKVPIGESQKNDKRNPDIEELWSIWEQNISPITANAKKNRYACANIIRKYGKEDAIKYIRLVYAAKSHRYAPAIADFVDLQHKADKLRLWAEKQTTTGAVATKAAYEKQNQQNYQIDEDF